MTNEVEKSRLLGSRCMVYKPMNFKASYLELPVKNFSICLKRQKLPEFSVSYETRL